MSPSTRRWVGYVATILAAALSCTFAYLWLGRPRPAPLGRELVDALRLKTAAALQRGPHGACPTLEAVRTSLAGAVQLATNDAWGTAFRLRCASDGGVEVMSAGPDRVFGSADDLSTSDEAAWPEP